MLDFLASLVLESIIGLPALPQGSDDWKRRRKHFVTWFAVTLSLITVIIVLATLNTYGVI